MTPGKWRRFTTAARAGARRACQPASLEGACLLLGVLALSSSASRTNGRADGRGLAGWLATLPLTFDVREPRPGVRCSCKPVCGNSHTYIESDPDGRAPPRPTGRKFQRAQAGTDTVHAGSLAGCLRFGSCARGNGSHQRPPPWAMASPEYGLGRPACRTTGRRRLVFERSAGGREA